MHDLVIVGAGPAALSAAIYTSREDISTLLFEKGAIGGLAAVTDQIDNYPGFAKGIAGLELADAMREQAERFGAKIELGEVTKLVKYGNIIKLDTTSGEFKAKAVLIATGSDYRKIGVPGEQEYYHLYYQHLLLLRHGQKILGYEGHEVRSGQSGRPSRASGRSL